jgi:hypothetical protein
MLASDQVDELICQVAGMERHQLVDQFMAYQATFPLDFSDEFLSDVALDKLRHIFVALCLQQQHLPESLTACMA